MDLQFQGEEDPPITLPELQEVIKNMNLKKAPGPDGIAGIVVQKVFTRHKHILLAILNSCLRLGLFPDKWKEANLIFLKKPTAESEVTPRSFRPICLLNIFSKLFEKIIHKRIDHVIDHKHPLDTRQQGFRKGGSTIAAGKKLMDFVNKSKTIKQDCALIQIDIAGAFDRVVWDNIMEEMVIRGLPSNIFRLINSYFQDRYIHNTLNDYKASRGVVRGCPQGSVLGPLFWNIIMDKLLQDIGNPSSIEVIAYADDLMIAVTGKNIREMEENAGNTLRKVGTWCDKFNMKINTQKSSAMLVTKKNKPKYPNFMVQNNNLKFVKSLRYLGILFDCRLKFYTHIKTQTDKARQILHKLAFVARQTWGLKSGQIEGLYKGVVQPIITYGCEIWKDSLSHKRNALMLKQVQRLAAIKKLRAYRTISHNSSVTLSGFIPIIDKITEMVHYYNCKTEKVILINNIKAPVESKITHTTRHPSKTPIIRTFASDDESNMDLNIYTDGSKSELGTGCAFVIYELGEEIFSSKIKLSAHCSAYQAELKAIEEALMKLVTLKDRLTGWKILIRSDSLSALKALQDTQCGSPLVRSMHGSLCELQEGAVYVFFQWVRGHQGVVGNERADFLAKESLLAKTAQKYKEISRITVKHTLRQETIQTMRNTYFTFSTDFFTNFFPTYDSLYKFLQFKTINYIDVQFFTGHGNFNQYLHRFNLITSPACPCNKVSIQNIKHLIYDCPRFDIQRKQLIQILTTHFHITWPTPLNTFTQSRKIYDHFHYFLEHIHHTLKTVHQD